MHGLFKKNIVSQVPEHALGEGMGYGVGNE